MKPMFNLLNEFAEEKKVNQKGYLCVGLVITRSVKSMNFPLNAEDFIAGSKGQVKGLGKAAVQKVLGDYGISAVLAAEGGRTSRGSLGNMQEYVEFLNSIYDQEGFNLDTIEEWWINRVKEFFKSKPFRFNLDSTRSLRSLVNNLLEQADARQRTSGGTAYVGAVMQHLVGAKLELALNEKLKHHGFSVADHSTDREGDFQLDQVVIHVTRTPTDGLMQKCKDNLESALKPIIVTGHKGAMAAENFAEAVDIAHRIDIFEIEQFIATNIYEISRFREADRRLTVEQLVDKYNAIVSANETDPSLAIVVG